MAGRGGLILPKVVESDVFRRGGELEKRVTELVDKVEQGAVAAAQTATSVSRAVYSAQEKGRPSVPARKMRSTTGGSFARHIDWNAHRANGEMVVDVDIAKLEAATPTHYGGPGYWLIQEIGTGKSAYIGGHAPWERRVTVKSQLGRIIPFGLVWGDRGGVWRRASQKRYGKDQITVAAQATRAPKRESAGVIGREIEGKHFLRDGGIAGHNQFRTNALAVAKQAFAGRPSH